MATDKDPPCQSCTADPNYAIICSFLEKFSVKCGISHFNFLELQEMLENTVEVRQPLIDLHIKLLRKARKNCSADKWERVVTKFCHSYSKQDGWELERFGYKNSRIEVKLRLLKHLLEAQFDLNSKFKSEVNKLTATELRIEPLGRDSNGQTYWCQFDPSCNIRIYKEDPDEEESWDLIAKDRVGLVNLIDELSSGEGQKELNSILNEDSNSLEIEKPIIDTGQVSSGTSPPELATDESLSQEIKQYSDSTNGSADIAPVSTNKEPKVNCDSDSNSRHPEQIETVHEICSDSSSNKLKNNESEQATEKAASDPEMVKYLVKPVNHADSNKVPNQDNKIAETEVDKTNVPIKDKVSPEIKITITKVKEKVPDIPKEKINEESSFIPLNIPSVETSSKPEVSVKATPLTIPASENKPKVDVKLKTNEILDNRIENFVKAKPILTTYKAPDNVGQDLSMKSFKKLDETVASDLSKGMIKNVAPPAVTSKEEDKSVRPAVGSDLSSNGSEDDASGRLSKINSLVESIKSVGGINRMGISKKIKGPPGSKLDEIFKFKRVHDPTTPTNLPPQSQPIPAYIGPGVKDSVLAQMKDGLGPSDDKRELTISRVAPEKFKPESRTTSRLEERLGEITQRLGMRQVEIKPVKSTHSESMQAEDLTKPKIKEPEKKLEPESKKIRLAKEPEFSEAVEEPLMLVRGEGSGADCNTGNPLFHLGVFQSSDSNEPEFGEEIEEPIMFFFGEGSGAECDTGNPELEKNSKEKSPEKEEKDSEELETENSEDKKARKLWSIDAICNKEKEQNCENSTDNQFFFGPGCIKDSEKPSSTEKEVLSNNNAVDKANCDKTGDCPDKGDDENKDNSESEPTLKLADKPIEHCNNEESTKTETSNKLRNEVKIKECGTKDEAHKSYSNIKANDKEEPQKSVNKHDEVLESNSSGKNHDKKQEPNKSVSNKEIEEKELESDSCEKNYDKKQELLKSVSNKENHDKEKACTSDSDSNDFKNKLHTPDSGQKDAKKEVALKSDCEKKDNIERKSPKSDINEASKTSDATIMVPTKSGCENMEDCPTLKKLEDEESDVKSRKHIADEIKKEIKTENVTKGKEKKSAKVLEENCDKKESKINKKKDMKHDQTLDEKCVTIEKDSIKSEEDGGKKDVKVEKKKEINPEENLDGKEDTHQKKKEISPETKSKGEESADLKSKDQIDIPEPPKNKVEKEDEEDLSNSSKPKQASKSRRSSKAVKEETKESTTEEVVETRRSRRSAALISTQLSENIIKPRGKKQPAQSKGKNTKDDLVIKDEPDTKEEEDKGNKKHQQAKVCDKGKKTPAKRGGSRKSSAAPEEVLGDEIKQEESEVKEEPKKNLGLNSFSFDVDDCGNVPMPVIPSKKRKVDTGKSEDEGEEEDDDEPLSAKMQRAKGGRFSKKKRGKGWSPKKKHKAEAESEDEEDDAKADEGKKTPKKVKDETPKTRKPSIKSKTLLGLTPRDLMVVEAVNTEELSASGRSVRTSRRIAQIKIKEQEEERKMHEQTMKEINSAHEKEKAIKKNKDEEYKPKIKDHNKEKKPSRKKAKAVAKLSDGDFTPHDQDSNDTVRKKKGRPKKLKKETFKYDHNNPWKSSSGSGSSDEDNDDLEHYDIEDEDEEEDLRNKAPVSDHEFSPESDLEGEGDEGVPVRHARTALKGSVEDKVEDDDTSCQKCGKSDHPEWILLCDKCDKGWHGSCLRPALMIVPEGDWFCPPCQHLQLVEKLKETLRLFERDSKRRDNDELRRKRLAYVGISLSNVLPPPGTKVKLDESSSSSSASSRSEDESQSSSSESSSYDDEPVYQLRVRRQTNQSYRFNDYDQLINSAIQDEMEAVAGAGNQGRGKDIENIVEAERQETNGLEDGAKQDEEEEDGGEGWRPPVVPRRSSGGVPGGGRKKSRKLTNIDVSSEDDQDSDEDFKGSSSSSEEESNSEYSSGSDARGSRRKSQPVRRSTRARTSRIDREFINDDSEDSDAPKKKKSRRAWSESESSESDETWGQRKKKPTAKGGSRRRKKKTKFSDSDSDPPPRKSKSKKSKVKYGLSEDEDYGRRTRGKKMNYQESESDDNAASAMAEAVQLAKTRRVIESDDEDDYKPEPTDKKKNMLSDSDDEDEDLSEEEDEDEGDKSQDDSSTENKEKEKEEEEKAGEKIDDEEEVTAMSKPEPEPAPVVSVIAKLPPAPQPAKPDSIAEKPQPTAKPLPLIKSVEKINDNDMFVGDVEEEEEEEEEEEDELGDELEEEEDDEELEKELEGKLKVPSVKLKIPSPVRVLESKPEISLTIKPVEALKSVKDKIVKEELDDVLIAVPGPIPKVVPVPVPASEIKEIAKEVEKLEGKGEKKPDPPKVNTIRIVPQHKLMANPPPQLEVKSMMMRPRVPGPHNMAGYPGMRFPPRPHMMRHPVQYPSQYPSQYLPYYSHPYATEEFPGGYCPTPPVHPQVPPQQVPHSAHYGPPEEGEFGGLVSYFSSQHEDNLDS